MNVPQSMFVRAMRKNAINMYKYVRHGRARASGKRNGAGWRAEEVEIEMMGEGGSRRGEA